ncbi:TGM1 [Bugula neritina]|uniref:TGM1 n=1 Tax=Bugula neritina TaxID=10212 RepID=A0A7J7KA50_BUGNE|nr:TGM1 [Bugula neritina]
MVSKGTYAQVMVGDSDTDGWYTRKLSVSHTELILAIKSPANCAVGKWSFSFDSVNTNENGELMELMQEPITCSAFILFNAWCEDDAVYLKNGDWADEYVLNDTGKVYRGSAKQIIGKPWNFGQFESVSLQAALFLLDEVSSLASTARGNPIILSRKLSALVCSNMIHQCLFASVMYASPLLATRYSNTLLLVIIGCQVNSQDDNGVLVGSWTGDYSTGTPPDSWSGSVAILKQYMQTKSSVSIYCSSRLVIALVHLYVVNALVELLLYWCTSVKFGQCWVFAGVLTTVFRAIGIPARPVTNFLSAHDTDGSLTIDCHYNSDGEPLTELNRDSVWNFHVWTEAWMTRPDLKLGYGGWQAVDSTPQETSDGVYRAGPASVAAIKNGDVGTLYDTPFLFAEVNADRIHWFKMNDGRIQKQFEKDIVGKNISTKAIGWRLSSSPHFSDREDLTMQYKHPEGSTLERAAVWRASSMSTKPNMYSENENNNDVTIKIADVEDITFGNDFQLPVTLKNNSYAERTVNMMVSLYSIFYTGIICRKLKKLSFQCLIPANSAKQCMVPVSANDYINQMADHNYGMKVNYVCSVLETKRVVAVQDDFVLTLPTPELVVSKKQVMIGGEFEVSISVRNPLKKNLTGCQFTFESAGNIKPTTVYASDIPTNHSAAARCVVTAKRAGQCVLIASFLCDEMSSVQSQCDVEVLI